MENEDATDYENSELYKKAMEIFHLSDRVALLCEDFKGEFAIAVRESGEHLRADAAMIPIKVAGAYGLNLYDIQMENATIIRKAARDLHSTILGLESMGLHDRDYLEVLKEALEEFRVLFAEWVQGFDPQNYTIDRWGLFNPRGVNYDDPDPDDDLPYDSDDFDLWDPDDELPL